MKFPKVEVTKTDAACRQLREAIVLFFERRDLVAVHTLAAASLQVLSDVGKAKGVTTGMLKHGRYIRDDKKKIWFELINEAQNFFKHADKDPDGVLDFKPSSTPFYIIDAVLLEGQLRKELSPASNCFLLWFYVAYPDVLTEEPFKAFSEATLEAGIRAEDFELFRDLISLSEKKAKHG
ncbi:MAG: hypothetical protein NVV69_07615 [Methyloversatilis sp.]|uniref:hypothetical protein n=1 Tax=Methyloversatilis sp. TaxID=2569862 RepID=UPI0025E6D398|nr:hypothetical protein [Methyloversatilis sp.]MCR6665860.1 hypothetical protein [Methyloversatilis sp.]